MSSMRTHLRRMLSTLAVRMGPQNPILQFCLAQLLRREANVGIRFLGSTVELRRGERVIRLQARHWPFTREVAANFDSYFSTLQSENSTLDFSTPALHRYIPSGLEYFLTSLPEELEAIDSYFVAASPQPGTLAFDVGANCGVTTHRLASLVGPTGKVIAFEPDPENYAALLDNMNRHNLANVTPVRKGIAAFTGQMVFNSEGTLGSGLAAYVSRPSVGSTNTIDCLSFADAIKQFGEPSFVKMDVEGAELAVLRGSSEALRQHRCPFALDTGHLVDGCDTAQRTESIFREYGYKAGSVRSGYITTWAVPDK